MAPFELVIRLVLTNIITMTYIPGTCNIGKAEIRQRQIVALIGLGFALFSLVGLLWTDAPRAGRLGLFVPFLVFAVGSIQARRRFCMAYGLAGTFNFNRLGKIERVADAEFRRADRRTALVIFAQAAGLAAVLTGICYLLP